MKKLFSLFLALCMAFFLASCVSTLETSTVSSVELVENNLDNVGAVTEAVTEETEAPEPVKAYPDNILMSDRTDVSTACVLGNENLKRKDVATVTFLDTLEHMPSNAWDVSDAKNGSVMAWYDAGMNLYIAAVDGDPYS